MTKEHVGVYAGNDVGDPIDIYKACYVRVPEQYLLRFQ